jgi:hypothetical protein
MRKIKICLVLIMLISGCTLLKRTTTTTDEDSSSASQLNTLKTNGKQEQSRDAQFVKWQKDSSDSFYQVRLWPKGNLSFSPENGFNGEFDSVRINGNIKRGTQKSENSVVKEHSKASLKSNSKQETHQNSEQQHEIKESFPAYIWIATCSILVGIALFFLFKR